MYRRFFSEGPPRVPDPPRSRAGGRSSPDLPLKDPYSLGPRDGGHLRLELSQRLLGPGMQVVGAKAAAQLLADLPEAQALSAKLLDVVPVKDLPGPSKLSSSGASPGHARPHSFSGYVPLHIKQLFTSVMIPPLLSVGCLVSPRRAPLLLGPTEAEPPAYGRPSRSSFLRPLLPSGDRRGSVPGGFEGDRETRLGGRGCDEAEPSISAKRCICEAPVLNVLDLLPGTFLICRDICPLFKQAGRDIYPLFCMLKKGRSSFY